MPYTDEDWPKPAKKRGRKQTRLTKLLRNRDHELYEIWNEYTAESVFFSGKPSKEELMEICMEEWAPLTNFGLYTPEEYVKKWIHVEPLKHVYSAVYER